MMLVHVARARHFAQQVLALTVLAAAARFAYVSYDRWSSAGTDAMRARVSAAPQPTPSAAPAGAPAPPEVPSGELISVVLYVSHGHHRSEVFLDEMPLGHTTYVGNVPCRRGSDVTIRIKPKRGSPIDNVRRCDGADISVAEK